MAEIISLFNNPDFDIPYGACTECGGDDWKMLVSADGDLSIVGFQCANIDCGVIGIFDENKDIIVFEFEKGKQ